MKTSVQFYRVDRRQISYIKFILEAYDNTAVVTTLDAYQAIIQVTIAPGCETMIGEIISGLGGEFEMVCLDRPAETAPDQGT